MATKLCRVRSTKSDGTKIVWIAFRKDNTPGRYAEAIKGASADLDVGDRAREAVDELFTYDEAEQLIDYLSKHYDDLRSKIDEEELPLEPTVQALHSTRRQASDDVKLREVVKKDDYPFPDSVEVYEMPDE
jgi:hypothetical protein